VIQKINIQAIGRNLFHPWGTKSDSEVSTETVVQGENRDFCLTHAYDFYFSYKYFHDFNNNWIGGGGLAPIQLLSHVSRVGIHLRSTVDTGT